MNKTVFITGSSRGIGLKTAEIFAKNNYNVVINCNKSHKELLESFEGLKKISNNVHYVIADVSDYEECKKAIEDIKSIFGGIDILINNAAVSDIKPFNDTTVSDWDRIIKNNLYSVLNCTHLVMDHMIHMKDGVIINVSSVWGIIGASCEAVYSASKGSINAFTKALSKELGPSNVRVTAIACGVIDTNMNDFLDEDEKEDLVREIPLMRLGKAEEVAELIYAVSKNKYMTGDVITIDGGMI